MLHLVDYANLIVNIGEINSRYKLDYSLRMSIILAERFTQSLTVTLLFLPRFVIVVVVDIYC